MTAAKRDEIIKDMRYKYTYNIHQWPSNCFEVYSLNYSNLLRVHASQDFVYDWLTEMINHPEWQDIYQYLTGSHYYNRTILYRLMSLTVFYQNFYNNYYL